MKWENKVIVMADRSDEVKTLDIYGAQHWEFVQVMPEDVVVYGNKETIYNYYLKRRVEIGEKLRKSQLKEVPNNDNENGSG